MRKLLFLVAIVTVVALLASCAPAAECPDCPEAPACPECPVCPEPEVPTEAPPAAEPVTIQVMLVDYIPDVTDTWLEDEVVPAFQAENPEISVEFIYVNWGTLDETIQGYFAAGEGADIINLGSEYIAEYGARLAPLSAYFDTWDGWEQFVPGTLDTVMWEGEPRGIPWLTAPRAYMCRTDILEAAGVEVPATTDDVIAVAGATTSIEGGALAVQGWTPLDDWQEYVSLIWTFGGTLYKDDGSPNFDSDEAKAALEFMYNRRRAVLPDEATAGLPETTGPLLATDMVACTWGNLWGAPAATEAIWENIALFPGFTDPDFPDSTPVVQVFNDWLAVPAYSPNVEAAAKFLMFLGSAENLNTYNAGFGSFPPRQDAWFGFVEEAPVMQELGALMSDYGVGFADVRQTAQFRDVLMAEMPLYFSDAQDLDTTMANIQEQYTTILSDAGLIQ